MAIMKWKYYWYIWHANHCFYPFLYWCPSSC